VVYPAEENGEDHDFRRQIIDLEVEDKILVGDCADARSNFCVFCAPVRMRDECPHMDEGVVDPSSRSLDSVFEVLSEFVVVLNEMFLDEVKVAYDIRRTADPIISHSWRACA
jgi:hypothetical protein